MLSTEQEELRGISRASCRIFYAIERPQGSHALMATFAEDGPERCSNLPVLCYSPELLAAELAPDFTLVESLRETHVTPALDARVRQRGNPAMENGAMA